MRRLIRRRPTRHRSPGIGPHPIQIVVTPGSGNGKALDTALGLRDALAARHRQTSVEVFDDLETLHRWADSQNGQFSALVCVGGDGTQSTTALAALRRSVPFLPVSSGFGNLFAQAFGHPRTVEGALDLLTRGRVVKADVGLRNGELFLCQQSYGLIAEVQEAVESAASAPRSRWLRGLAYYRAAVRHLRETRPGRLRVVADGREIVRDAALVIVANVKAYGAWLPLISNASPVDGLLDVFVMRAASRRRVFGKLLRRHLRLPGAGSGAHACRAERVSVSGDSVQDELEVLRQRLPVIVSPEVVMTLERGLGRRVSERPLPPALVA
jgi:diacylglycerol kinase (ATP)